MLAALSLRAGFQSHAGSIEAEIDIDLEDIIQWFQSHAGSIEAGRDTALDLPVVEVSIPRWFD